MTTSTLPAPELRWDDDALVARFANGLMVSVQASDGSPLRDTEAIWRIAAACVPAGARGLRVNGVADVAAVRAHTPLPVIGILKTPGARRNMITLDPADAARLAAAGADVVAVDATREARADVAAAVRACAQAAERPVMADVSTFAEGIEAWEAGALLVGTTLSGYTPETAAHDGEPDIGLVARLAAEGVRVVAEGRYRTAEHVRAALDAGAHCVVVGGAISDPGAITARLVAATEGRR